MIPVVWVLMGMIYFLWFMLIPFTNIDLNELSWTKMDMIELKKINIKFISEETLFWHLVIKYLPSLNQSQWVYYRDLNTIYLVDVWINKNKENLYETLFHEYLHYIYQNRMRERMWYFHQDDFKDIVNVIQRTDFDLLMSHTLVSKNNIYYWLTEYISHKYMWYLYYCKDTKDDITDILIRKELLPQTIYCNNVAYKSDTDKKIEKIIELQKEVDYLRDTLKN